MRTAESIAAADGPSRPHIPALDGLRGIAIISVVVSHVVLDWPKPDSALGGVATTPYQIASFGWAGVDLFFALSGFLITGILLDTRGRAGYYRWFYARRARRIWPLYLTVLAALALAAVALARWIPGSPWANEGAQWLAAMPWFLAHVVNWRIAVAGTWTAAPLGTGHLWSLAVEEQFYLIWPFVIASCRPARLARICLALALASAVLRIALLITVPAPARTVVTYVVPVTHLEPLVLGAYLAVAYREPAMWARVASWATQVRTAPALGSRALAWWLLILALLLPLPTEPTTGVAVAQAVGMPLVGATAAAGVAVALTAPPTGRLGAMLRHRALVWAGRISYGWYTFHYIAVYAVSRGPRLGPFTAGVVAWRIAVVVGSAALAWASWRWWESRWLTPRTRPPASVAPISDPA